MTRAPLGKDFAATYRRLEARARRAAHARDQHVADALAAGATAAETAAALSVTEAEVVRMAGRARRGEHEDDAEG